MTSRLTKVMKNASQFLNENSPAVLTALGVAGAVTTAVLAGHAGYRAGKVIQAVNTDTTDRGPDELQLLTVQEKFMLTWKFYIPPVLSCGMTIAAVIAANQISSKRAAAFAAAYSLSEKALTEYKDKVVERIGEKEDTKIRDEIAQNHVDAHPVSRSTVLSTGAGDVLCFERYTGRYFYSSHEAIRQAVNDINHRILHGDHASLSDLYDLLALPHTEVSDDLGWNTDDLLEVRYSTTLSEENKPCLVISYDVAPNPNYYRFH